MKAREAPFFVLSSLMVCDQEIFIEKHLVHSPSTQMDDNSSSPQQYISDYI